MKRQALSSVVGALGLLAIVLVAVFTLTGVDISGTRTTEVSSTDAQQRTVAADTGLSGSLGAVDDLEVQPDQDEAVTTEVLSAAVSPGEVVERVREDAALQTPAGPLTFTGDAEVDFDPAVNPDVVVLGDTTAAPDVGVSPLLPSDTVSGFDIEDIRFLYDDASDQLFVAMNFFGIGGDAEGDGDPGNGDILDPANPAGRLGTDEPEWGPGESVSIMFDLDGDQILDVIAGIPVQSSFGDFAVAETTAASGQGFSFEFNPASSGAYGAAVPGGIAISPEDTSAQLPDLEFAIGSLSSLVSSDLENLGVVAFAGSAVDIVVAEDLIGGFGDLTSIPNPLFAPAEPGMSIVKTVEGEDANTEADAVMLPVGSTASFEFVVTNTGDLPLTNVSLTDNVLGLISCPATELAVDAVMTCTASAVVTEGLTTNTATASAQPTGIPVGELLEVSDPANHVGVTTTISIEKATNGVDADDLTGPEIEVGGEVTFTYLVTNNGPATVTNLVVSDDIEGEVCTIASLDAGEDETCELTTTAGAGQYANNGSVVGQPVDDDGQPFGEPLTATDPSHHLGVCSNLVEGPLLLRGGETIWNTDLVVGDNSTITVITSENGGSPNQPNEQVYIEVAGELYGPSPAGLGTMTIDVEDGGRIRVIHVSEVEDGLFSANSVIPSLCGGDLEPYVPVCADLVHGPLLHAFAGTEWETGLIAGDNSTIRVVTEEHGGSPDQPHEQVYLQVGDDVYGPTPAGLGDIEFEITAGGPVTVVHYSVETGDRTSPNSVVPSLCGDDVSAVPGPLCPVTVSGPRMIQDQVVEWDSGLTATAGSEITIVTSDDLSESRQPNEQVYVMVGDDVYGPTPVGLGTLTFEVMTTGEVSVVHYSVRNGEQHSVNSVEFELCGTGLTQTVNDYS